MEQWYALAIVIGIILFIIVIGSRERTKKKVAQRERLIKEFGQRPVREYSYEEFESLKDYYEKHKGDSFSIDDITWNDFDMDTIFMLLNHTQSSLGQEYLYYVLRTPKDSEATLEERNRLAQFFENHEKERVSIQEMFANLGRVRKYSFFRYLYLLGDFKDKGNGIHFFHVGSVLITLLGLFFSPSLFIVPFLLAIVYSIVNYYRIKGEIEPYMVCMTYVIKMLHMADSFSKEEIEELSVYQQDVKQIKGKFQGFRRNSFLISSGSATGGGIFEILLDYVKMIFHVDLIKFHSMTKGLQGHWDEIEKLSKVFGEVETGIAIASFRKMVPYYSIPIFKKTSKSMIKVKDIYHPMIEEPVANSIATKKNILLTGSNASGKSTFLRTIGISSILSQTIDTALCTSFETNFFHVYSSMALRDDLENQDSYYMAEIKALKRVLDACEDPNHKVLCFIDEVLRGTNTVERIAASSQILKSMNRDHILCFAATHDIELTHLLEDLYENYFFTEDMNGDEISFHYLLHQGRSTSRNAIKLLEIMGYDKTVTSRAKKMAEEFLEKGIWELE